MSSLGGHRDNPVSVFPAVFRRRGGGGAGDDRGAPTTPRASERTEPIVAWLTCDPAGGTHPFAAEACADLAATGGDIAGIGSTGGCGGVFQPVEISAWGRWQGDPVRFTTLADLGVVPGIASRSALVCPGHKS